MVSKKGFGFRGLAIVALLLVLPLTGCYFGKSQIVVSDGGSYDIYVNDSYLCTTRRGDCSLTTRGGTGAVDLQAVKNGEVAGEARVSRSITLASILWAPFTYYSSLFIYKAYPDEIYINVGEKTPYRSERNQADGNWNSESRDTGNSSGGSAWDKPLLYP